MWNANKLEWIYHNLSLQYNDNQYEAVKLRKLVKRHPLCVQNKNLPRRVHVRFKPVQTGSDRNVAASFIGFISFYCVLFSFIPTIEVFCFTNLLGLSDCQSWNCVVNSLFYGNNEFPPMFYWILSYNNFLKKFSFLEILPLGSWNRNGPLSFCCFFVFVKFFVAFLWEWFFFF